MITAQDVIDMTDLTADEVEAICEHEHLPSVNGAALAEYLLHIHHGPAKVQAMICDDIRLALHRDDLVHARQLYATLHHFVETHPDAVRGT